VWRFTYATLIHALARVLRIASADAVYVRGSFASGEPIYGLSDLDLIAVTRRDSVSDAPSSQRLRQRIARVYDSLPVVKDAVELSVFEVGELERAAFSPFATYPYDPALGTATPRARFFGDSVRPQPFGARPDAGGRLYGPLRWWRLVTGRDYAAALPESPPEYRWLWAWSDLQFFWRHAPRRAVDPASAHTPYFSTKMIAEPAALWLWLQGEQRAPRAVDSLERASVLMPEERETLERARELRKALPERTDSLLVEAFGFLLRVTFRITALLAEEVSRVGTTEVRLFGRAAEVVPAPFDAAVAGLVPAGTALEPLPLVDWRARLGLELPDEALVLLPGDPGDPKLVGAVALAAAESRNPVYALRSGDVLVLPNASRGVRPLAAGSFRAVQCPATDPVSFALLDGRSRAAFPNLPGWNAPECAERAVLEHRAWLESDDAEQTSSERKLGMLFSAARAALFAESFDDGDPQLPLTVAAVAERLGADRPPRAAIDAAFGEYRTSRSGGAEPSARSVTAFRDVVCSLRMYRSQ
jgi:hypothetical protein